MGRAENNKKGVAMSSETQSDTRLQGDHTKVLGKQNDLRPFIYSFIYDVTSEKSGR